MMKHNGYFFGAAAICLACALWEWKHERRRPAVVASTIADVFARGYVPAEAKTKDCSTVVARPQLHTRLQSLLRPNAVDNYTLIVGAHGTGKVRGVRESLVCRLPSVPALRLTFVCLPRAAPSLLAVHCGAQGRSRGACGGPQRRRLHDRG